MAIDVYTDGSCLGNPGPGGYGVVIFNNGKRELSGGEKLTTNNKMEMMAAIVALSELKDCNEAINLHTDSKYVIQGITEWINGWKRNGWKTAARKPVKNAGFWVELDRLNSSMNIKWIWVKGHSDNEWNERCDVLARTAAGNQ